MSRPATSRLKVNPAQGTMPVLQYCTPDQLRIDDTYQRTLETGPSQTLVRRITMFWDWSLCQPLIVARRDSGEFFVVDGQHRLAAAKLRGDIFQLPCVVASYASAADEAASFVALNQQRRALSRLDVFKAALAAGDADATSIAAALDDAGLRLATSTNLDTIAPGSVSNVGGLQKCLRAHGPEVLSAALDVLAQSYKGQVLRYAGSIFPGIAAIVASEVKAVIPHETWADCEMFVVMTEMVGGAEQTEWRRDMVAAKAEDPNLSYERASVAVFERAWAECTEAMLDEAA
jgi:hypothetical protein